MAVLLPLKTRLRRALGACKMLPNFRVVGTIARADYTWIRPPDGLVAGMYVTEYVRHVTRKDGDGVRRTVREASLMRQHHVRGPQGAEGFQWISLCTMNGRIL